VGLAIAYALIGNRVLLVECDLRRPVLAERLGLVTQPGITDWLNGDAKPAEVVQRVPLDEATAGNGATGNEGAPLAAIVAGNSSPRAAELLASGRFREFLDQVSAAFDLVVLDCAPLLTLGDTLQVLPHVDAVLVCARVHRTTREQAHAAKAALDHLPPRPAGAVVTGLRPGHGDYYYSGYYSSFEGRSAIDSRA
jgi:Mrp family chromosome partitioning ATPase